MKVLDLRCAGGHGFEGWFGSDDDYRSQQDRGLVSCPLCGSAEIERLPSAPRLNLSGGREPSATVGRPPVSTQGQPGQGAVPAGLPGPAELQALWLRAVRHVMAHTEDVGERFADEARRMHYGEAAPRGIRGQASAEVAVALQEEGIELAVLPVPDLLKEPVQ